MVQWVPALGTRQRSFQQRRNLFVFNRARAARAQLIIQTGQTPLDKTASPLPHCGVGPLEAACDLCIAGAFGRPEHHFGAGHDGVRERAGSSQTGHLNPLILAQNKLRFGVTDRHIPA